MEHYIDGQTVTFFIERLMELERSSQTISKYIRDVTTFRRWLGDNGSVDKNKVIRFKQMLREKYRLSSVNSMLSALNKFFQLLGWDDCYVRTFKTQRASFRNEERELSIVQSLQKLISVKRINWRRLVLTHSAIV